MAKLLEGFKVLCTDFDPNFEKKGGNYSRGDINQGNMYLNFDFFLNQVVPDLRR